MTVRCERCGTVARLDAVDGDYLCEDCIRCERGPDAIQEGES